MGHRVNGDRFVGEGGQNISILVVLEIQLSQSMYIRVGNKEKLCL